MSRIPSSQSSRGKGKGTSSSNEMPPPVPHPQLDEINLEEAFGPGFESQESAQHEEVKRARAPPTLRSDIFAHHFQKVPLEEPGNFKVFCNYCDKVYPFKVGGGYGTLNKHLRTKHPSKVGITSNQTQFQRFGAPGSSTQADGGVTSPLFHYNDKVARKELAKVVCAKHLPYRFANDEIFENWISNAYNPSAKRISRSTLTRDIDKLVIEWKNELINIFSSLENKVSICSDIWSDHWQQHFYMGITCHWVDHSWILQKRLIAYREFDVEHTAINISHKIRSVLQEYNLLTKIFSVSFDNASANTASLSSLIQYCQPSIGGKFFHIRCICHILNLCVQDGLNSLKVHVNPIRQAISYLVRHVSLLKKWKRFCRENELQPKKFSLDVPTRWNSTYKMLCGSYEYRSALCDFFSQMAPECNFIIFPQQWESCGNLCHILQIFHDATTELSGIYYPTSILALDHCIKVAIVFNVSISDPVLKDSINSMRSKWLKYFYYIPNVFLVAKLLDPRVRYDGLVELLTLYYSNLFPNGFDDIGDKMPQPDEIAQQARQQLFDLFKEYKIQFGTFDTSTSTTSSGSSRQDFTSVGGSFSNPSILSSLYNFNDLHSHKCSKNANPYPKLENYLTTTFE